MIPFEANEVLSTSDFETALKFSTEKAKFQKVPIYVKDFLVTPSGQITIQNNPYKVTEGGIKNICEALKIPDPFANMIPDDLLITNLNRLMKEESGEIVNTYFDPSMRIIDFNFKTELQPIDNRLILEKINSFNLAHNLRVKINNHFTKIEFVPETKKELINTVGELHSLGFGLMHYPTAKSVSYSLALVWTVACTNGALISRELWKEKINLKSTSDASIVLDRFFKTITESGFLNPEFIQMKMTELKETKFILKEFELLFNSVKRLVGKDEVSNVLGSKACLDYDNNKEKDVDYELDLPKYKVYYDLTNYASNICSEAQLSKKLQLKAGNLLLGEEL